MLRTEAGVWLRSVCLEVGGYFTALEHVPYMLEISSQFIQLAELCWKLAIFSAVFFWHSYITS